ncbi:MAG: UDP-N-acetylglucosamine 4,6-dehydratase family protein [Tepidisphaeraceae bacterium]
MSMRVIRRAISALVKARAASGAAPADLSALLGRKPVNLDTPELQRFLAGKRVLVTGAGGSIGSEICRQTMRFCPGRLILLDRAENSLFEIDRELAHRWVGAPLAPVVADVCDPSRIQRVFADHEPQVIFHAAAHKHVPMMEHNPGEAVKNNVLGTKTVADAAASCGVSAFVLISTDKAVNPTSVMGATKRAAELYVQSMQKGREHWPRRQGGALAPRHPPLAPRFLTVRFGNVLGSSGSVVPIFVRQIAAGGPVTVTHPEMKRYFMTIPEASQLVMQAGAIGRGGEIFVLDMGRPVAILDLAREMIRRSGLRAGRDIEIEFTGVRPGEKLDEELARDDEQTAPTSHEQIRVLRMPIPSPHEIEQMIQVLRGAADGARDDVVAALAHCVPEYRVATVVARPSIRLVDDDHTSVAA